MIIRYSVLTNEKYSEVYGNVYRYIVLYYSVVNFG